MSTRKTPGLPALVALALFLAFPRSASANPFLAAPAADGGQTSVSIPASPASPTPRTLVELQLAFRDRIAAALSAIKEGSDPAALWALLGGAFVYGIFHAAGPGHRKAVVFSLFMTRRAAPWEPLAAGFLSAAVHALAGIVVVLGLGLLRGAVATLGSTSLTTAYLEGASFVALVVIAAILALLKIRSLVSGGYRSHSHGHAKGAGLYGIVIVASLVPCPGAVMVLLFALYLGLAGLGIAGILAMSTGMGIVVSAAAYLAYFGREGLFNRLKRNENLVALASSLLELSSYLLVLAFSAFMAWPFVAAWLA